MKKLALVIMAVCSSATALNAGGGDVATIAKMLDAALRADKKTARDITAQAIRMMEERKIPALELEPLAGRTLELLRHVIETPDDARAVFPEATASRQILYRRYREQWVTTPPLVVRIVFDCRRGREPVCVAVEMVKR